MGARGGARARGAGHGPPLPNRAELDAYRDMLVLRGGTAEARDQISLLQSGDHVALTWDTGSVRLLNTTLEALGKPEDFIDL